ncbi:MAG: hypothetical protein WDZ26_06270 [Nitriliruptoraceae bacterium]
MAERPADVDEVFEDADAFDDGDDLDDDGLEDDLDDDGLEGDLDDDGLEGDLDDDDLEGDLEVGVDDDEIVEVDLDTAAAAEEVEDDEAEATVASVIGVFDDEPVVGADDDGEDLADDVDGIREREFVCRRCHLAKRDTQLADEKAMLCRDCA